MQGSSLGSDGEFDSQTAAALGSSKQQQHQAVRRQQQWIVKLAGDASPSVKEELR